MTVSTTVNRAEYNGDASTTVFAYPFKIFADSDLEVYVGGALQTLTTDYSVSGAGNETGGDVTFVTPPPTGTGNIILLRNIPQTQGVDLVINSDLPSDSLEDALDRAVLLVQDLQEATARAIALATTSVAPTPTFPEPLDDGIIKYKATATDGLEAVIIDDLVASLPGGTGGLVLVEKKVISVNTTSVTFSGLDGDTHAVYVMQGRIKSASTSANDNILLKPNGATTALAGNWRARASAASTSTWNMVRMDTTDQCVFTAFIHAKTGMRRHMNSLWVRSTSTAADEGASSGVWNETSTNITSLVVEAGQVGKNIEAGSEITLYRVAQA